MLLICRGYKRCACLRPTSHGILRVRVVRLPLTGSYAVANHLPHGIDIASATRLWQFCCRWENVPCLSFLAGHVQHTRGGNLLLFRCWLAAFGTWQPLFILQHLVFLQFLLRFLHLQVLLNLYRIA